MSTGATEHTSETSYAFQFEHEHEKIRAKFIEPVRQRCNFSRPRVLAENGAGNGRSRIVLVGEVAYSIRKKPRRSFDPDIDFYL
jgi:hypothetical protein